MKQKVQIHETMAGGPVPLFDNSSTAPHQSAELLTLEEAAKFLTISKSGIRRLQHGRHLPYFKVGGSVRFARCDLNAYLARRRVASVDNDL